MAIKLNTAVNFVAHAPCMYLCPNDARSPDKDTFRHYYGHYPYLSTLTLAVNFAGFVDGHTPVSKRSKVTRQVTQDDLICLRKRAQEAAERLRKQEKERERHLPSLAYIGFHANFNVMTSIMWHVQYLICSVHFATKSKTDLGSDFLYLPFLLD